MTMTLESFTGARKKINYIAESKLSKMILSHMKVNYVHQRSKIGGKKVN